MRPLSRLIGGTIPLIKVKVKESVESDAAVAALVASVTAGSSHSAAALPS
jgi:hypothetical protein